MTHGNVGDRLWVKKLLKLASILSFHLGTSFGIIVGALALISPTHLDAARALSLISLALLINGASLWFAAWAMGDEEWTPGSPEAIEAGCTCPRGDNCNGAGMPSEDGPLFWVNGGCPLHGEEAKAQ